MKPSTLRRLSGAFLVSLGLSLSSHASAAPQTMCVWDPLGAQGDYYNMLKDYQLAAKRWGVDLELQAFTDEGKSVEAFKSGSCDIINMIGYRARLYNQFTGSIEAPGAIENYADLREALSVLASPKVDKYMTSGDYEVAGIIPLGAGYPFVNDRKINGLGQAKGKKVAVVDWDPVQSMLVRQVEAVPVPMNLTEFGPKFNKGTVDVLLVPMVMYKPLELSKGMGSKGGIIHRPMLQFTMQLITRKAKFPATFGASSREYMLHQVSFALGVIHNQEAAVEPGQWIYANTNELKDYNRIMGHARAALTTAGFYDSRMLNILKRIRCRSKDASDPDCAAGDE